MNIVRASTIAAITMLMAVGSVLGADRTLRLMVDGEELEVPLKSGQLMSLLADGDVAAEAADGFTCSTEPEQPDCDDVQVSLDQSNNLGYFTVSPNPVTQGQSLTLEWRARGAWECEGSGLSGTNWSGQLNPAGSRTVGTSNLSVGDASVGIECRNGAVSDQRSITLEVLEPDDGNGDPPESCDDRPTLSTVPGWSRETDIGGNGGNPNIYTDVFPGNEFPGTSNNFSFSLRRDRYVAMRFTVPDNLTGLGSWRVAPMTGAGSPSAAGRMFATITRCPGDFDVATFEDKSCGAIATTSEGIIRTYWTVGNTPGYCSIEPGETYYFNVLYSVNGADPEDFPPQQSDCNGRSRCGHYLQPALF
ncbi:hypothetical protein IC757_02525 [Wenzhouxiangella sp. AB-CW3]|uniref:hypothetical protein n=1 Tax=Wenzhouxiangella sp. AB-CW3 TaxID=2771012 RepID=UPI00168A9CBB|nr:hypothetical protein [Wenzhouxiangella sp. AB-CW3]QOC23053.1 hypothetical protein IC757_02525 [Wenzhouxiangella sp. AB-CW3]